MMRIGRTARRELIRNVALILRSASVFPPHYWRSRSREDWVVHLTACIAAPTLTLIDSDKLVAGCAMYFASAQNLNLAYIQFLDLVRFDEALCDGKLELRRRLAICETVLLLRSVP